MTSKINLSTNELSALEKNFKIVPSKSKSPYLSYLNVKVHLKLDFDNLKDLTIDKVNSTMEKLNHLEKKTICLKKFTNGT